MAVAAALLGACGDEPADEAPGQVTTTAVALPAPTTSATLTNGPIEVEVSETTSSLAAPRP